MKILAASETSLMTTYL